MSVNEPKRAHDTLLFPIEIHADLGMSFPFERYKLEGLLDVLASTRDCRGTRESRSYYVDGVVIATASCRYNDRGLYNATLWIENDFMLKRRTQIIEWVTQHMIQQNRLQYPNQNQDSLEKMEKAALDTVTDLFRHL